MCIALPCRVETVDGLWGDVAVGDSKLRIRLDLIEDPTVGEWVLVHAGFAIERLDESEAQEALEFIGEALGDAVA
jgi:hydrogenase expression/formation protein HypC